MSTRQVGPFSLPVVPALPTPATSRVGQQVLVAGAPWSFDGTAWQRVSRTVGQRVTTNGSGLAVVTFEREFADPPVVTVSVENASTTLGAFGDVLAGSVTTTGCTVRAWRLQVLTTLLLNLGANPGTPFAAATVHVMSTGVLK